MNKYLKFIFALIFLINLSVSCKKKRLSKPVDVNFKMDINRSKSSNGKLIFNNGTINIAEFNVEGSRIEGEDIAFSRSFNNGLTISFDPNNEISELKYDIPQGEYTELTVSFDTYEDSNDKTIVVNGTYTTSSGDDVPIKFEFMSSEYFSVSSEADDGSETIILDKDVASSSLIKLDPIHWFGGISTTTLDNATRTNVNGAQTILINDEVNGDLYDLVADKIDEATESVFK